VLDVEKTVWSDFWVNSRSERMPQAVREALRMGAEMEVLEPLELRAAIAAEANRIARRHGRRAKPAGRKD
jgi:predicted DNA-binding transcriptional regulator YafY